MLERIKAFIKEKPYISIFILFILSRIIIFSLYPLFDYLGAEVFNYEPQLNEWESNFGYIGKWLAFDSEHYLKIANEGYHAQITAFFPLYPLLMKFLSSLTGLPLEYSGIIISNVSFLLALFMFYKLLLLEKEDNFYSIILLVFSPITIYFLSIYTESLFLFLTISSFYLIRKKKWASAAIVIGIASLTRNSGVVLYLCWLIEYITEKGWKNGIVEHLNGLITGGLLMISYPLFLLYNYGNPTIYVNIQSVFWNRYFTPPWEALWADIKHVVAHPAIYTIVIFNFIFFILALWMIFSRTKIRPSYLVFTAMSIIMPLFYPIVLDNMPYTTGVSRYTMVLFPVYIFLSKKVKKTIHRIILLEVFIGFLILFTTAFIHKQFLG